MAVAESALINQQAGLRHLASGAYGVAALGPEAEAITKDWVFQKIADGYGYVWCIGSASTPISWAKTAYDEDQPQVAIRVPLARLFIPISVSLYLETSAGTLTEVIIGGAENDIGAGTSTAATTLATGTERNMRHDNPRTSGLTINHLYTANATAATNLREYERWGYPFADATTDPVKRIKWTPITDGEPIFVTGAGTFTIWIDGTGTAPTGYAIIKGLALDKVDPLF